MAAGVRSLLAFWMGGAGATQAQGSVRNLLAFWMGGAGAAEDRGVRSLLAFWMGGAGAIQDQGYRSLLAFWMGGGGQGLAVPPIEPAFGGGVRRAPHKFGARRLKRDEEEILLILSVALQVLNR